jgi:glycerate 2-kinase
VRGSSPSSQTPQVVDGKGVLNMSPQEARSSLRVLFAAAIEAVHPRTLIQRVLQLERERLVVRTKGQAPVFPFTGRVFILGAGKGAGFLAQGLETILKDRVASGVVILPHGQNVDLQRVATVYGEHPLPGPGSLAGAEQIAALLQQKTESDLILFCLTGGASSLLVSPAPGLSLQDKLEVNRQLIACGADIYAINTVRKHLSRIKGGGLARWIYPTSLISFVLSDVIGDDLSTIGSGPTAPDPTTFGDAWRVIEQFHLQDLIPLSASNYLRQGLEGLRPETPKPGDVVFTNVSNIIIGSNRFALEAAAVAARACGFSSHILPEPLSGDTTDAATHFAQALQTSLPTITQPVCILAGGETTVHVTGAGKGGRNQEFALVVAHTLQQKARWTLLSAGTDGIDGPTDAAGAFADGLSIQHAEEKGWTAQAALNNNDSYSFFSALGDLFCPGQTGTNVMDIKLALLWP